MLTIETDNPDIDVDDLMQRVEDEVKKIKRKSLPLGKIVFSVDDKYEQVNVLPPIELKDQYHINELIGLRGDHFVISAYRAIIQEKPDPEIIERYKVLFSQGAVTKKELLCRLRYSPAGKKKNIQIKGLFFPCLVGKAFRIPVVGYFCRIIVCIVRLPALFRIIQRLDNVSIACQEELKSKVDTENYSRDLKRISLAFQMTEQRIVELMQEIEEKQCVK